MRKRAIAISLLAAAPAAWAEVPETLLTSPLAETFGRAPTIGQPKLSPDGNQIIFLQQDETGASRVALFDFTSGEAAFLLSGQSAEFDILWCDWGNATRVICEFSEEINDRDLRFSFMGMNTDGSDSSIIDACTREIDWLPDDPDSIVTICGPGTRRIDLYSPRTFDGTDTRSGTNRLVTDGRGMPRVEVNQTASQQQWYATEGDGEWIEIYESRRESYDHPFRPVGFAEDPDEILHIGWNGSRWALFAKELSGEFADRQIFEAAKVDVEQVDLIGGENRAVAVRYLDGVPQQYVFDERAAGVAELARELLPGMTIEILDESWDRNVYLLRGSTPERAGYFFRAHAVDEWVEAIGAEYDYLIDVDLAPTETLVIETADGAEISAHLTLPRDRDGPVPFVVIPRHDAMEDALAHPHTLTQFLAASGYGVLRVNQRGPAEFDSAWLPDWIILGWEVGAADLKSAMTMLVDQDYAASGEICLLGRYPESSYAATITAIQYPDDVACLINIEGFEVPVRSRLEQYINLPPELRDREFSPIRRAGEMAVPVLIFDVEFSYETRSFVDALENRDRDVTYIEYSIDNPDFDRGPLRIDMLTRIGEFLARAVN